MQNIKCPNCGEVFQVDESGEGYTKIVQQVRNSEFEKELAEREQVINEKKENEFKLYKIENEKILQNITAQNELKFAKYKITLPVCWLLVAGRYLYRLATRKSVPLSLARVHQHVSGKEQLFRILNMKH